MEEEKKSEGQSQPGNDTASQNSTPTNTVPTGIQQPVAKTTSNQNYQVVSDIPDEVKKWNWGAFFLTWIWGLGNGVIISLIALIPAASLIMAIVLGIKGGEWAWQTGRFASVEAYQKKQRTWAVWGWILCGISFIGGIAVFAAMVLVAVHGARVKASDAAIRSNVRALASAINEYRSSNSDQCPASLNVLVPNYTKSIPTLDNGEKYSYTIQGDVCIVSAPVSSIQNMDAGDDYITTNGNVYDLGVETVLLKNVEDNIFDSTSGNTGSEI